MFQDPCGLRVSLTRSRTHVDYKYEMFLDPVDYVYPLDVPGPLWTASVRSLRRSWTPFPETFLDPVDCEYPFLDTVP